MTFSVIPLCYGYFTNRWGVFMEPILFLGGVIVVLGGVWTIVDLLQDAGILAESSKKQAKVRLTQACSGFRSRDISSSTACRAGLLP